MTKIKNPLYSEVHSEVILGQQPIRTLENDKGQDAKLRSRIPKMRNVVEIYKQRKIKANEEKEQVPLMDKRRSSIPRLKRNSLVEKLHEETLPTEKEFDKIYDEIVLSDDEVIDTKILDKVKVDDAEKIEDIFDEIIHDYEENKIEPLNINELRSRIPLTKQKSLPEEQMVKKLKRRLSLKDIKVEDDINIANNKKDIVAKEIDKHPDDSKHITKLPKLYMPKQNVDKEEAYNEDHDSKSVARRKKYSEEGEDSNCNNKKNTINENVKPFSKDTIKVRGPHLDKKLQSTVNQNFVDNVVNQSAVETKSLDRKVTMDNSEILKEQKNDTKFERKTENISTTHHKDQSQCTPAIETKINSLVNDVRTYSESQNHGNESVKVMDSFANKGKVSQLPNKIKSNNKNTNNIDFKVTGDQVSNSLPKNTNVMCKPEEYIRVSDIDLKNVENTASDDKKFTELQNTNAYNKSLDNDQFNSEITIEKKYRRDSIDRVRYRRSESIPVDIDTISLTPPNTPNTHAELQELLNYEIKSKPNFHNNDTLRSFNAGSDQDTLNKSCLRRPERNSFNETTIIYEDLGFGNIKNNDFEKCTDNDERNIKNGHMISVKADDIDNTILDAQNDHVHKHFFKTENMDVKNLIKKNLKSQSPELSIDGTNQTVAVEAVCKDFDKMKDDVIYDQDITLKGKVSRMISRIHSVDESVTRKEVIEIPIRKSVSSKIAMFEQHNKEISKPKFHIKAKGEPIETTKPRIIDQVLKPIMKQTLPLNNEYENNNKQNRPKHNEYFSEGTSKRKGKVDDKPDVLITSRVFDIHVIDAEKMSTENLINSETVEILDDTHVLSNQRNCTDKEKRKINNYSSIPKSNTSASQVNNVLRMETGDIDTNLRKSKSMAELSLVNGKVHKVHEIIGRMNSVENLDVAVEKKDNINIKERPRRKSVSDKIALFERKLIVPEMDPIPKPIVIPTTVVPELKKIDNDYSTRIEDLVHAKETYGTFDDMVYVTLRNGVQMPVVALGTALMDPVLLPYIIGAAIDMGFRAIDTAYIYGNEDQIGAAIRAKIEDGTVKREDLFIIGKLWSTFHRRDLVQGACEASLKNLGIEYFDLYLVHNPMSFKEGGDALPKIANVLQYSDVDYIDAWYGMEDLVQKGLAKSIGVSNFNSEQIGRVVDKARIKPVINQVECHPYLTQVRLDQFCSDRDVKLMCFGTLGSKGTPDDWKSSHAAVIDDPLVKVMAAGLNVTPAQLLIRYQVECGHALVTKASKPRHLWEVLEALKLKLTPVEVDALQALNRNKRTYSFIGMGDTHKNYPFKIPY